MMYWNDTGRFNTNLNHLHAELVPASGEAETLDGELLRCMVNLYYDVYNNAFCNIDVRYDEFEFIESQRNKVGIDRRDWNIFSDYADECMPVRTDYGWNEGNRLPDKQEQEAIERIVDAIVLHIMRKRVRKAS